MKKNILITGGNGFVGRNILGRLLFQDNDAHIHLIIRPHRGVSGKKRSEAMLGQTAIPHDLFRSHITVHEGNITEPYLGLEKEVYEALSRITTTVFHSAASIKFNLSLEEAMNINVAGTRHIVDFARLAHNNGVLERFNHISTAYVTGAKCRTTGRQLFVNTYEESKSIAEQVVLDAAAAGLPAVIYRPSIISGNSITGEITSNNLVYIFLLLLSRNSLPDVPCDPGSSLNIIPVDAFIDILFRMLEHPVSAGRIFNISNSRNANIRSLFTTCCNLLGVKTPRFVPFSELDSMLPEARKRFTTFIPYFEESHYFDLADSCSLLNDTESFGHDVCASLGKTVDYCMKQGMLSARSRADELLTA